MIWRRWVTESSSSATQASSDHLDRRAQQHANASAAKRLRSSGLPFTASERITGKPALVTHHRRRNKEWPPENLLIKGSKGEGTMAADSQSVNLVFALTLTVDQRSCVGG